MDEEKKLEEVFGKRYVFEELNDEEKYDVIIGRGKKLYETREEYGDVYAFHKAVELVVRECKQHNIEIR